MYLRRDELRRTARPPAKLNLHLEVFGRRGDGFHELETLMVPVRLYDCLSITSTAATADAAAGAGPLQFRCSLATRSPFERKYVPAAKHNLVVRALELLRQRSGCTLGACIELVKRIPAAAGLGGGSSDAAAALVLANRVWRLGWSRDRLADLAAEIGSDVPFFLFGGAAVCRSRGERVEKLPAAAPLHFVLVKPPVDLSTADVYRAYDALPQAGMRSASARLESLIKALIRGRLAEIGRAMRNALQAAAATLSPWVERARSAFDELDCLAHQLSGSGSAYFGLCRHAQHARRLASVLRARGLGLVYALRSCP
ncbi:MAG: 4-(cytidine 5'-diphospho)-2-C-methyl-D-erythritol kinase [Pirellulales bacterium]